jgi:NhaP-type Na+/H+ or K+/H+ antiporter
MSPEERVLVALASIVILGVGAQWLAWRVRVPSILLLLAVGFVAGPVTGFLQPDAMFGALLFPLVSLAVGLILFEGGLSLRLRDLRQIGAPLWGLITVGALLTWGLTAWAARAILGLDSNVALLLGAILVVTGPTVVGPLLRHVRPAGRVAHVAHWEGIVIDPVGASLAVLVFEVLPISASADLREVAHSMGEALLATLGVAVVIGGLAALVTVLVLRRFWVPDFLQSPMLLMLVTGAFTASNLLRHESGLFTVTLMGVILANQRLVPVRHIIEFKENLRVLLISALFILLAARIGAGDLVALGWRGPVFVAFLIVVVRPTAVFFSTLVSRLNWRERLFLAWLAPRGIVAAAVASVFALRLGEAGEALVPACFLVIVGTVAVYGITAGRLARRLGLSHPNPQGVVFASAHRRVRDLAATLKSLGIPVLLIDTDRGNVNAANLDGLATVFTSILSERALDAADEPDFARLLAMTSDDEVNSLATVHFRELFGRAEVYQLPPHKGNHPRVAGAPQHLRGRTLFSNAANYQLLDERLAAGHVVKASKLTKEHDFAAFRARYGEEMILLFVLNESSQLVVATADHGLSPRPGQTVVALVPQSTGSTRTRSMASAVGDAGSARLPSTSLRADS